MFECAKKIITESGFSDKFMWLEVVQFDELFSLMNDVDVVVDQLGGQYIGQGMWAGLLGKPVITSISQPAQEAKFKNTFFLHASNSNEFIVQLEKCLSEEYRLDAIMVNKKFVAEKLSLEKEFYGWPLRCFTN
jgi:hypothetical protein